MFKRFESKTWTGNISDSDEDVIGSHTDSSSESTDGSDTMDIPLSKKFRRSDLSEKCSRSTSENNCDSADGNECIKEEPSDVTFFGKYHCSLCPRRVLLSEADLNKHMQSKVHQKREIQWDKENRKKERMSRRSVSVMEPNSQKKQKSTEDDVEPCVSVTTPFSDLLHNDNNENILSGKHLIETQTVSDVKKIKKKRNKLKQKKQIQDLTEEQIQKKKEKFQRKKERRALRQISS